MPTPSSDRSRRLGRGLDFLLASSAHPDAPEQVEVELARIQPNPWQPRRHFDEEAIEALAQSVRQHGLLQPIAVRRKGEGYELIAGERRVLAARRAGLSRVPAIVRSLDDSEMLVAALIENLQRADLNPVDRARALKRLVDEQGKSHEEVAGLAGLARSTVSNSIRLLELDDETLDALASGSISEGHARALLAEPDTRRRQELLRTSQLEKLNVRTIEQLSKKKGTRARSGPSEDARRLEKVLAERLRAKVRIFERGTRGRIVLEYTSLKEFDRLFADLAGAPPPEE